MNIIPISSFPKSGNTWLRFLIGNVIKQNVELTYSNISSVIPADWSVLERLDISNFNSNGAAFIKEHSQYNEHFAGKVSGAIYVIRNGFDVLSSYFEFIQAQAPGLYKNIEDFSEEYWYNFGTWGEHANSWINHCSESKPVVVIKYEDLLSDPFNEVKKIMRFFKIDCSDEVIKRSVQKSSSKEMKKFKDSSLFMNSKIETYNFVNKATSDRNQNISSAIKKEFMNDPLNYIFLKKYYPESLNGYVPTKIKKYKPKFLISVKRKVLYKFGIIK
jgi:hypothetical protein